MSRRNYAYQDKYNDRATERSYPSNGDRISDSRNGGYSRRDNYQNYRKNSPYGSVNKFNRPRQRNDGYGMHGYNQRSNFRYNEYEEFLKNRFRGEDNRSKNKKGPISFEERNKGKSKKLLIEYFERRISELQDVVTLNEVSVIDSGWSVKPKGFEEVTAQRAKLSGLFPLPGYPRPVDFTKLEDAARDRLLNANDILRGSSKIEPLDSKNSKVLLIRNIDFSKIDFLKLCDYLNKFLSRIDVPEATLNNIESKKKTKDNRTLIIEFKEAALATIIMSLNKVRLPIDEIMTSDSRVTSDPRVFDAVSDQDSTDSIMLDISRPKEYVVQRLSSDVDQNDCLEDTVVDSPFKTTLIVSPDIPESEILEAINKISRVKVFQLLREKGTKTFLGIVFAEFYTSSNETFDKISNIKFILEEVEKINFVRSTSFSCIDPLQASVQECPSDFRTLKQFVNNENVNPHPRLKTLQLINIVSAMDLVNDETFSFIQQDILIEASKFGKVESIKIPRPANDYTPGISQFAEPGLGKVFIEFEDEEAAINCIMGLAGRTYNDRTVICAFYDDDDFRNGLF